MGQPRPHGDVLLIVGMLSRFPALLDRARGALAEEFGPVRRDLGPLPFTFSDYYEPEMGPGLLRVFLAFERPIRPDRLADVKLRTNALEAEFAGPEWPVPRPINLDPGYLELAKLVLATTKDHAHRLYLRDGIYAEITLSYHDGAFRPMPWTYPDYRSEEYRAFFEALRGEMARAARPRTGST
jgi:hypothetical protein